MMILEIMSGVAPFVVLVFFFLYVFISNKEKTIIEQEKRKEEHKKHLVYRWLNETKKLTEEQREEVFRVIRNIEEELK